MDVPEILLPWYILSDRSYFHRCYLSWIRKCESIDLDRRKDILFSIEYIYFYQIYD